MLAQISHHTEKTQIKAVHALAQKASTCRVAVAYCGEHAYMFFPEAAANRPENLLIMIDASDAAVKRGLTNPKGIEYLLGLTAQVRSVKNLHAKVFLFDECAALVGSTNLSASSLMQDQMTLEVSDPPLVQGLIKWFEHLFWYRGKPLDSTDVKRLIPLWPKHPPGPFAHKAKGKLDGWLGAPPQPPPTQSDFKLGTSNKKIQSLLSDFKSNVCGYHLDSNTSCFSHSAADEKEYAQFGKALRTLMHRASRWTSRDLSEIFDIAQTNGAAAMMLKPQFIGQSPMKVAKSLVFLLKADGDPYVRFEKLLVPGSRYKLFGLGAAGLSFLMHLWNPKRFAIVNKSVDDALKALKLSFGRSPSQRQGEAYRDRTAAVLEIARLTKLKTFTRADHFLDAITKKHIG